MENGDNEQGTKMLNVGRPFLTYKLLKKPLSDFLFPKVSAEVSATNHQIPVDNHHQWIDQILEFKRIT